MLCRSVDLIYDELKKRGCQPHFISEGTSLIGYTHPVTGVMQIIKGVVSPYSGAVASSACNDKWLTYQVAQHLNIAVPETIKVAVGQNPDAILLEKWGKVVVKPAQMTAHGDGITVDVENYEDLIKALKKAHEWASSALIQQQVTGDEMRVLVVGGKVVAATRRVPATLIGDGTSSINDLLRRENERRHAMLDGPAPCFIFLIDEEQAAGFVGRKQMSDVPRKGQKVQVIGTSNVGSGGNSVNVTDELHEDIGKAAEKLASGLNLQVGGLDFLVDNDETAWLIEMNVAPAFVLQEYPHIGKPVMVTSAYVDHLLNAANDWNNQ